MPRKDRKTREIRQRLASDEWDRTMPPMPEWMRREGPRKGNLWAHFHPSIRKYAQTDAAEARLAEGNKKGFLVLQVGNLHRRDAALNTAKHLRSKYPKQWLKWGGAKEIAFCEEVSVSTVNRYKLLLKRNSQGR